MNTVNNIQSGARWEEKQRLNRLLSVSPEALESPRSQVCIPNRVGDLLVAEIMLYRSGVDALVSEVVACWVTEHMRVDRKRNPGLSTG